MNNPFIKGCLLYITGLTFFATVFIGCKWIDPDEDIPTFIHIEAIVLETNSAEGSSSDNITDAWVYANDQLIGVFELPATVPVLSEGDVEITIRAGIKNFGISGLRSAYPFYTTYDTTISFSPGANHDIFPIVNYKEDLAIWNEDFEDPGFRFVNAPSSDTSMTRITTVDAPADDIYEGNASGKVHLLASQYYTQSRTDENFDLPLGGAKIFLELDYKCNRDFTYGILHRDAALPSYVKSSIGTITSTADDSGDLQWNKIYIELTEEVNKHPAATDFEIYFDYLNADGSALLYFDNVKIIYPN